MVESSAPLSAPPLQEMSDRGRPTRRMKIFIRRRSGSLPGARQATVARRLAPKLPMLRVFDDEPSGVKVKTAFLYAALVAANVLAWLFAFVQFRDQPMLLGTASLA